jgi:SAM-dependent methyltransferase
LLKTFLHTHPEVWDQVFHLEPRRVRFITRLLAATGPEVLDVGCATGALCGALAARGLRPTGVDLNPVFIQAARRKFPDLSFQVGDMRRLKFRSSFHALTCLGTTFLYNVRNQDLTATLAGFHRALRPGGLLVIDVVNAISFVQARPFRSTTVHRFRLGGVRATATIEQTVIEEAQSFTEQVTWQLGGQPPRRDPRSSFRMLFPEEARHFLEGAGFRDVQILGDFRRSARRLDGPRMLLLARKV